MHQSIRGRLQRRGVVEDGIGMEKVRWVESGSALWENGSILAASHPPSAQSEFSKSSGVSRPSFSDTLPLINQHCHRHLIEGHEIDGPETSMLFNLKQFDHQPITYTYSTTGPPLHKARSIGEDHAQRLAYATINRRYSLV